MEKTIYDCDVVASSNELVDKVANFKSVAQAVAEGYTKELDSLMEDIRVNVIDVDNVPTVMLEKYLLQLTNSLYFIGSQAELADMYMMVSKLSQKESYSKSYLNSALPGYNDKSLKRTASELDCIATLESLEETALAAITKSAQSIVATKTEAAKEMIRSISKVISIRLSDSQYLDNGKQILNEVM